LRRLWRSGDEPGSDGLESILRPDILAGLDAFDRIQLAEVVRVCRQCRSLSAAGRTLFAASRTKRKSENDADRLRKYLARFELSWAGIGGQSGTA
jgi:transcriptional regulatory protein RtcR